VRLISITVRDRVAWQPARVPAVLSSPDLGVFAVAAGVFCVHFRAWWAHYLHSVSAAGPVQVPLSLLFLELNGY
jgi:hypothetical protein